MEERKSESVIKEFNGFLLCILDMLKRGESDRVIHIIEKLLEQ